MEDVIGACICFVLTTRLNLNLTTNKLVHQLLHHREHMIGSIALLAISKHCISPARLTILIALTLQRRTFTTMSWMDSWSRPSKSQATPPPLYLTQPDTRYCHTCGRVISERKSHKAAEQTSTPPKYCSAKCRGQKPRDKDRRIEAAFLSLLSEDETFEGETIPKEVLDMRIKPKAKGERRLVVPCSAAETLVYGSRYDPAKVFGRRKNRASRALSTGEEEWLSVDMVDGAQGNGIVDFSTIGFAGKARPAQHMNDVNGSIGGEKGRAEREQETSEAESKRFEGQRIAEERELVKRAARRCCVFGAQFGPDEESTRYCEAIMQGQVVQVR